MTTKRETANKNRVVYLYPWWDDKFARRLNRPYMATIMGAKRRRMGADSQHRRQDSQHRRQESLSLAVTVTRQWIAALRLPDTIPSTA